MSSSNKVVCIRNPGCQAASPQNPFDAARHHCRAANQGKGGLKALVVMGSPTCAVPDWGQPTGCGDGSHRCGGVANHRALRRLGGNEGHPLIGLLLSSAIEFKRDDRLCSWGKFRLCARKPGKLGNTMYCCRGRSVLCHCATPSCGWGTSIPRPLVSHLLSTCWPDGPMLNKYASVPLPNICDS
jgi:hypothetical protein